MCFIYHCISKAYHGARHKESIQEILTEYMNECLAAIPSREGPGIISHSRCNVEMFNRRLDTGEDTVSELQDRAENDV